MYKPQTIEQFKIYQYIKNHFEMDAFILSPISRIALMLENHNGEKIAFSFENGQVQETSIPEPASRETAKAFIQSVLQSPCPPQLKSYQDVTRWWLNTPNPLSYQQAVGLSDGLYRHFLTHEQLDYDGVMKVASKKVITESEYNDVLLWYLSEGHFFCWLGPSGVDGTGDFYRLITNYRTANERSFTFYLKNEYYCQMNSLPYNAWQ